MTPEQLKNFRPYSDMEVDRMMADQFRQLEQTGKEERQKRAAERAAQMRPLLSAEATTREEDAPQFTPSPQAQVLKRRLLAAMERKPRSSEVSSSLADPEPELPISEPSHAETTAALADSVARVRGLVAVAPESKLDATPSGLDHFPVASLAVVPEFDDPGRELAALFRHLLVDKNYLAVRDRCCQLSIRMNLQGAVAPAFRGWPRGVAPFGSAIITLITRDQIVIDYHWCHATLMPLSPTDDDHKNLLDLDIAFDFRMAWELSGRNRKAVYRGGEALCLTPLQQCQTIQLRGRELHERMDRIFGGYRKSKAETHSELAIATAAIGQWINGKPRFKSHRISYERLWQTRELLGPGASKQSIAELHALMLGAQPLDRKTIAGKLETLSKVVDVVLRAASTP